MNATYYVVAIIIFIAVMPNLARYLYRYYRSQGYSEAISLFCSLILATLGTALIAVVADIAVFVISGSIWLIGSLFHITRFFS